MVASQAPRAERRAGGHVPTPAGPPGVCVPEAELWGSSLATVSLSPDGSWEPSTQVVLGKYRRSSKRGVHLQGIACSLKDLTAFGMVSA